MLKQLGIAALYALLHYVGEVYFDSDAIVGYFEMASGLALAVLLLGGKRYAWGVLLGAVLIHAISDDSLWEIAIISLGDTLQALCGAWLLTRDGKVDLRLQSLRGYLRLILLGGCVGIAIGALAVNTILLIVGVLSTADYFHGLLGWWMSDTLGVILITPLILVWGRTKSDWPDAKHIFEAVLLLGVTFLTGQMVFLGWMHNAIGQVAKGYWMFLLIAWIAVRLGTRGVTTALTMIAIQALLGAYRGTGYFANDIVSTQLLNYWIYMLVLSVVGMALATYFTEHKRMEAALRNRTDELALHSHILGRVSLETPLCEVLEDLVRQIEIQNPGMLCTILLMDKDGKHLRHGAAPSLPDFYNQAIDGLAIGDGIGACGTAAYRGERIIVADVQQHPYWQSFRELARQAGVQSCWSQPIKGSDGGVLGTFAIYHRKPTQPSEAETTLIERYASLAALVIERTSIQEDLRLKDIALNAAANAIVITDEGARIKWVNQAFVNLTGYSRSEAIGRTPRDLVRSGKQDRRYYEQLWQTILSGKVWHGELINRRKDDSLYHEEMTIAPVADTQGKITHFVAVKQDITKRKEAEQALRKYKLVLDTVNDGFWITDATGNILETNTAYATMLGYTVDEVANRHVSQLDAQEKSVKEVKAHIEEIIAQGHARFETRHRHKNGHEVDVEVSATFVPELEQFFVFIHDITSRKQAEAALRESEENLIRAQAVGQVGSWCLDIPANHLKWSAETYRIFGIPRQEAIDLEIFAATIHPDDRDYVLGAWREAMSGTPYDIEHRIVVNGKTRWVRERARVEFDSGGQPFSGVGTVQDITERKAAEEEIHSLAFYDALTTLPNRRLLDDRIRQVMAASKRSGLYGALMFLDLDNFKPLNDMHGHDVGDLLLTEAARRITGCVREADTVARFGGDEFVVVLSELDANKAESADQARIVAEKIRTILAEPYALKFRQKGKAETVVEHRCTSSIGVALFTDQKDSPEDVLKWADMAMYQAKEGGRNRVHFYSP